eukprot:5533244-Prymnesium_polylepis.1
MHRERGSGVPQTRPTSIAQPLPARSYIGVIVGGSRGAKYYPVDTLEVVRRAAEAAAEASEKAAKEAAKEATEKAEADEMEKMRQKL